MYDYDLIVVGCGASSYGFLKGLEKNKDFKDKKIAVLCPSEYKQNTVKCNIKGISPKFLQDKNLLSLSYYLDTFVNVIQNNFSHIGVHAIGGMCRMWGGSIGTFDKKTLNNNNLDFDEFSQCYAEIEKFLPFSGNEEDDISDYFDLKITKSVVISQRVRKLYGKFFGDTFKVGHPRLLVRDNCNQCNQCLAGCKRNSIWSPLEQDFLNIKLDISLLKDSFATKITKNRVTYLKDDKEKILNSRYIILAGGVMQNYKLLANLENVVNTKAKLLNTPALAFSFFNFTKNFEFSFFGMGNATFILENKNNLDFYGNLYDGYSLAVSSGRVVSNNKVVDSLFKIISKYLVFGASFVSSDYAECSLEKKNKNIVISGRYSEKYQSKIHEIQKIIKKFSIVNNGMFPYSKKILLGNDIHYGGGIPGDLYSKTLVKDGNLKNISHVKVVGGSTFSYLPPVSPTLSYIANSYRIGKQINF